MRHKRMRHGQHTAQAESDEHTRACAAVRRFRIFGVEDDVRCSCRAEVPRRSGVGLNIDLFVVVGGGGGGVGGVLLGGGSVGALTAAGQNSFICDSSVGVRRGDADRGGITA